MNSNFSFCIYFSGLTVRFVLPTKINIPECFSDLLCEDTHTPCAEYRVELIDAPLRVEGCAVYKRKDFSVYHTDKGYLRIYTPLTEEDGCQVACLINEQGKNILYYPASKWEKYSEYWHCTHLLCGELFLYFQNALLLHSSVVAVNGKAVLFSGESGAGKSTQAGLWEKYHNAEILNGDRCVIMRKNGVFYGGGSPWSGTSGIYKGEHYPIAGIFLLNKAAENSIRPLGAQAFTRLFSQTTVNSWHKDFVDKVTSIYVQLMESVPIFELNCLPDKSAADIAFNKLFGKENSQ